MKILRIIYKKDLNFVETTAVMVVTHFNFIFNDFHVTMIEILIFPSRALFVHPYASVARTELQKLVSSKVVSCILNCPSVVKTVYQYLALFYDQSSFIVVVVSYETTH